MEDGKGGVFVRGLEEELVTTANEIYKILEKGSARRCTAEEAIEILVGGKENAWKIPSSESDSLNKWAGSSRFRIGDSLVWKYDGGKDSVLQVSKEAYASCITSDPIAEYKDGNTKFKLHKSGPFYFISGAKGHCEQGQKLVVVVLSPRHSYTGISPAPSPAEIEGPAVAPTSNGSGLKAGFLVTLWGLVLVVF